VGKLTRLIHFTPKRELYIKKTPQERGGKEYGKRVGVQKTAARILREKVFNVVVVGV